MNITVTDLWLCDDCTQAAVNGDLTSLDYHCSPDEADERVHEIASGLERLGPNLVIDISDPDEDPCNTFTRSEWVKEVQDDNTDESWEDWAAAMRDKHGTGWEEFSTETCDCCGSNLAGARTRFAILGD